jgi:hypothetical protein
MTEAKKRAAPDAPGRAEEGKAAWDDQQAEGRLGRIVARALPPVTVVAAILVGALASVPSALLVLASGVLLGAIALLWASVRTLSGDAPLPGDLEVLAAHGHDVDGLAEQKRRILRALKDLENERAIGRIDAADYEAMAQRYREDAKAVMKQMDERVAPAMEEAERLARDYLKKHRATPAGTTAAPESSRVDRRACAACGASNELDAAFCKQCGAAIHTGKGSDATA